VSLAYLLDTNIVSLTLKGKAPAVRTRLAVTPHDRVAISIITAMELQFGLAKHPEASRAKAVVEPFLTVVQIANLPEHIAPIYGTVRATLERRGQPIGPLDTIIAAQALALGCTLVTNNLREFRRVPGLRCQDWSRPTSRRAR
jgi:tRNA(fMet)-specific endonuclease VapC